MDNKKTPKTIAIQFADGIQYLTSKVQVPCSESGEIATWHRQYIVDLVQRKYENNYGLFLSTYVKKRRAEASAFRKEKAVKEPKVKKVKEPKEPKVKKEKKVKVSKQKQRTAKVAPMFGDAEENEKQPESYRRWVLLSYNEALNIKNQDKAEQMANIYWNRYGRLIKEDLHHVA